MESRNKYHESRDWFTQDTPEPGAWQYKEDGTLPAIPVTSEKIYTGPAKLVNGSGKVVGPEVYVDNGHFPDLHTIEPDTAIVGTEGILISGRKTS